MSKILKLVTVLFLVFFAAQSLAMETDWQGTEKNEGKVRFIYAGKYSYEGKEILLGGIEFEFQGNWHTYWKNSGDSGMPVTSNFSKSENLKDAELLWVVPEREIVYGIESFVYKKHVILPVILAPEDASKNIDLKLNIKYAVCDDICLFSEANFDQSLALNEIDAASTGAIENYLKLLPKNVDDTSEIKLSKFEFTDKNIIAEFKIEKENLKENTDLFITENGKNFRFSKPEKNYDESTSTLKFLAPYEILLKGQSLEDKDLELVLANGENSIVIKKEIEEISTPVKKTEKPTDGKITKTTLLAAIIAAFIGGLILNIMPCVLPVLSLKIFGMVKHGASDKKYIRKSFFFSTLGILFSFLILATGVIILKDLGHSVGWGIQFQQPYFVIFLILILTFFASNQWGWFEVLLPYKVADKVNTEISKHDDNSAWGNFLTGTFATLLATPCTAPFLTTAVSFAFAADSLMIILIFLCMGLGLALPYILIMITPALVKIFPKPGAWMEKVRHVLGFLIYITIYWLLYVLMNNSSFLIPFIIFGCVHTLLFFLYISKRLKLDRKRTILAVSWVIFASFALVYFFMSKEAEVKQYDSEWVEFNEAEINSYVKQGRVVFVDVTADWCLTCKFNKLRVVNPMMDFFKKNNVVLMKADYTRPSEKIQNYLVKNGTYAIPFNKVYGPAKPEGVILKEVLTKEVVRKAVYDAKE